MMRRLILMFLVLNESDIRRRMKNHGITESH